MDNRVNPLHELFSRGSTPPVQQSQPLHPPLSNTSSPNQIDSLFHQLSPPDQHHQSAGHVSDSYGSSASVTSLLSLTDEPVTSSASTTSATNADRQSALLSLLGTPSSLNVRAGTGPVAGPPMPQQQVPTPPGAAASQNEAQGKFLLEQLMAG